MKAISRVLHLFSASYIIGQSFSVFLYGIGYDLILTGNASYILESIFLAILAFSGILSMWSICELAPGKKGRSKWLNAIFCKMVAMMLFTRILEALMLSLVGENGQKALT